MSLESFLKTQKSSTIDGLRKAIENEKYTASNDFLGEKRWTPEFPKKSGAVEYVLRFLPCKTGVSPRVPVYYHNFDGENYYVNEVCPTTVGEQCPICDYNRSIWNTDQQRAREQGRRKKYFSNILVIKDPIHPENEGKVFVYEMPMTIMEKHIDKKVNPDFESEEAFDPFNLFSGANFHMRAYKDGGYWKYDRSSFAPQSQLTDNTDMTIEEVFEQLYDISSIATKLDIKSSDVLTDKLKRTLGLGGSSNKTKVSGEKTLVSPNPNKLTLDSEEEEEESPPWNAGSEDSILSDIDSILSEVEGG